MKKLLTLILLIIVSNSYADIRQSAKLIPYKGSEEVAYDVNNYEKYTYIISEWNRRDRDVEVYSKEGKVSRFVYKAPQGINKESLFVYYKKELVSKGYKTVFESHAFKSDAYYVVYKNNLSKKLEESKHYNELYNSGFMMYYVAAKGDTLITIAFAQKSLDDNTYYAVDIVEDNVAVETTEVATLFVDDIAGAINKDGKAIVEGITFKPEDYKISPASARNIKVISDYLIDYSDIKLYVVVHTDDIGSYEDNVLLSEMRAKQIVEKLVEDYGVELSRLTPVGVGPVSPLYTNDTEGGRRANNRVELVKKSAEQ